MLVLERPHPHWDGVQKIYRFPNGYGASVIRATAGPDSFIGFGRGDWGGSYGRNEGLWELGVIRFNSEDNLDFNLTYSTHITDDVLGYLTEEDVERHLNEIEALPDLAVSA